MEADEERLQQEPAGSPDSLVGDASAIGSESYGEVIGELVEEARALLDRARRVVVLTGAGISTDSGIRDFRGPDGVWTRNPAAERAATLSHYMAEPETRRRSWRNRLDHAARRVEPNAAHHALVELERRGVLDTLITQNVDGLHHAAGHDPDRIVEMHGNMREVVCMACGERGPMAAALDRVRAGEDDPPCRTCGGILKSATISFGQNLVVDDLRRADEAARRCDLLLAVGSTLAVYPVAGVVPLARSNGAVVVIVNGSPTEMDDIADCVVHGPIGHVLPALMASPPGKTASQPPRT